jgi:hypothetical protein
VFAQPPDIQEERIQLYSLLLLGLGILSLVTMFLQVGAR